MKYIVYTCLYSLVFLHSLVADDWNGINYAENSSVQLSHAQRLLNGLSLLGNENILDLGCGDGKITTLLTNRVPQGFVIGVDPSDSMLEKAKINRKESGLTNLIFEKGSAENFNLNQQFDHIIAIHVMHWIKDQEKALTNVKKHLAPEGRVHFILAPSKEGLPFYVALQKTLENWDSYFIKFENPQQVFDMETYRKLMVRTGFHIEAIYYLYHESIHENKEKLTAWVKQWQPHVKHLPLDQQTDFLNELMNNYFIEMGLNPESSDPVKWGEYVLFVDAK